MITKASRKEALPLTPSRFNFSVPTTEGSLLFNCASGAVLALDGADGTRLATLLTKLADAEGMAIEERLSDAVLVDLCTGGFLVPIGTDEVGVIRDRYLQARRDTPVVLTLTTTMDCNLGCYYCYEERKADALAVSDVKAIVALAAKKLHGRSALHVDWYGGEPLLNIDFIEEGSRQLQEYCASQGIRYAASVISNGTSWPEDVKSFISRHAIRQVQISFDGLKTNHERRRRVREGFAVGGGSSFDAAVQLVDKLVHLTRTDIRFNIDRGNKTDLLPFLRFGEKRGWFRTKHQTTFQPARISAYSERSSFMRNSELSLEEYDELRSQVREAASGCLSVDESEAPEGFPVPRNSVCAALAKDSVVVGADKRLYRCGLQVSESFRSTGSLNSTSSRTSLPILQDNDASWWDTFDPTRQPRCSKCSFLPICWGGCPKKHLERDLHALREQGAYWRHNLARLVAERVGRQVAPTFEYSEEDQFRDGIPEGDLPSRD